MNALHDFRLPVVPMALAAGLIVVPMLAMAQTSSAPAAPPAAGAAATRPTLVPLFTATAGSTVMLRPRLSQLIGSTIYNDREEKIGEVEDILLFPSVAAPPMMTAAPPAPTASQSAAAPTTTPPASPPASAAPARAAATAAIPASAYPLAVVQVGGFLGMGGRLITVPLADLRWNAGNEHIVLPGVTKEMLQTRTAFEYSQLQPR
ncbi:hypothetical protein J5Y09_21575 [Roseomonas sp. PWR1]|uniref:PRC-barrel domain-containing protein n=1 Tax=Roseomonas nitratireducens TaxID=2820810 RepID=A0ABS4AYU8_9PROT|nr:PRC-barrel domain-containing protein [Neoroseomonas nitratireducens]MBP0466534.1 hypothetical protein [Neoroseomonas nitratireducens]